MVRLVRLQVENESKTRKLSAKECSLLFNLWNVDYFLHIKLQYISISYVTNKLFGMNLKKILKIHMTFLGLD